MAAVLSVIGAIVGEFVGSEAGLGYLILQMNFNFDMPGVFAVLIILSLMGIGLHMLVVWVQGHVVFWVDKAGNRVMGARLGEFQTVRPRRSAPDGPPSIRGVSEK